MVIGTGTGNDDDDALRVRSSHLTGLVFVFLCPGERGGEGGRERAAVCDVDRSMAF